MEKSRNIMRNGTDALGDGTESGRGYFSPTFIPFSTEIILFSTNTE